MNINNLFIDETSQIIIFGVSSNTDTELSEDFTVTLSNPTGGATITTASANGTIQNDDGIAITRIHDIQGSRTHISHQDILRGYNPCLVKSKQDKGFNSV